MIENLPEKALFSPHVDARCPQGRSHQRVYSPKSGSTGTPSLWCNYGNLWLIILEPCGTYSLKKREEFLGVREDAGIELHYAICTVYYNFSMSAVLVSNINALPFICIFKDM